MSSTDRCARLIVLLLLTLAAKVWASDITKPPSIGTEYIANEGATGTTANKLVILTGAPSTAIVAPTSSTGIVGICLNGCSNLGTATIAMWGVVSCVFDGATTAGHFVQVSASVAGDCTDAGATYPTSGQILGRVLSTHGGGGTYQIYLFPPDLRTGGTVTSVSTGCGLTGGPITGTGTIASSITVDLEAGAGAFAIPNADCGKLVSRNQVAAVSDTIAQAGGGGNFLSGWWVAYQCRGAGGCTITPAVSTIDGAASLVLVQDTGATIYSDGANYFTLRDTPAVLSAYRTVENGGAPLAQRSTVNFSGTGITCSDNAGPPRTECVVAGGGTTIIMGAGGVAYSKPFVGATSLTITAAEHLFQTANLEIACYDTTVSPSKLFTPNTITIDGATFQVVADFGGIPMTGYCVVNAGGGTGCQKFTITSANAAFQAASTTADITLFTLAQFGKMQGITIKHSVIFSDGAGPITDVSASVGNGIAPFTQYSSAGLIGEATPVSDTTFYDTTDFRSTTMTVAGGTVSAHFIAAGGNFGTGIATNLISGSVNIWACSVMLP